MLTELTPHEAEHLFDMLGLSAIKLIAISGFNARAGDERSAQRYQGTSAEIDCVMEDLAAVMAEKHTNQDSVAA